MCEIMENNGGPMSNRAGGRESEREMAGRAGAPVVISVFRIQCKSNF
jgi:hypothetical protein